MAEKTSGIEGLIEKLKSDGIAAGETSRQQLLENARQKATEIISEAEATAKELLAKASLERSNLRSQLNSELKLAARDFVLSFKQEISKSLTLPQFAKQIDAQLSNSEFAAKCLEEAILSYTAASNSTPKIFLSDKFSAALSSDALERLTQKFSNGKVLELHKDSSLSGFKLSSFNGQISWQVSTETLVSGLSPYIDKKLVAFLTPDIEDKESSASAQTQTHA